MAGSPEIEKAVCRQCFAVLDSTDRYCRHCGAPRPNARGGAAAVVPVQTEPQPPPKPRKPTDNPWIVLSMLFLALGPLALPLLWRSRGFNIFWKIVLTILVVVIIAIIIALMWYVIHTALAPLRDFDALRDL